MNGLEFYKQALGGGWECILSRYWILLHLTTTSYLIDDCERSNKNVFFFWKGASYPGWQNSGWTRKVG